MEDLVPFFRPNLNWRFGLAVHTPTFYSITDQMSSAMTTNTEDYAGTRFRGIRYNGSNG